MSLPTDFDREIAERVQQPGFDAVLARAGRARRRRRTTVASGVAALVVVAGAGLAVRAGDHRSAEPAPAVPTTPWDGSSEVDPRLPASVRTILRDEHVDLWAVSGSGGVAAVWRGCDAEPCRFAVVIRDGDRVVGATLDATAPRITAVPGGWLLEDASGISLLNPAGGRESITVVDSVTTDVLAGDTAVETADGWRLLRGHEVVAMPSPSEREILGAYVTPSGRLVAASTSGADVTASATDDGRTWEMQMASRVTEPVATAVVAGNGDHVAVAFLGDDPDGSIPVLAVQVSSDAGLTWTDVAGLDTDGGDRLSDLSSLAVSAAGTTYVTTGSHHVVRIDVDGDAVPMQLSAFDTSVFTLGEDVCVVAESGEVDRLECSADDGRSWTSQPLPGFR